jgi:hypothetical protein
MLRWIINDTLVLHHRGWTSLDSAGKIKIYGEVTAGATPWQFLSSASAGRTIRSRNIRAGKRFKCYRCNRELIAALPEAAEGIVFTLGALIFIMGLRRFMW